MEGRATRRQFRNFSGENFSGYRIFVSYVDVDVGCLDNVSTDQCSFEKPMRIGVEEVLILECTGLTFIAIHGHQPRTRFAAYGSPLTSGRKTRSAQTTKGAVVQNFQDVFD